MEESNDRFKDLYFNRLKDNAGKSDLNLKKLRKESAEHYKTMAKRIEAFAIVKPSELYDNVSKDINQAVEKYNQSYRSYKNTGDDESDE